MAEERETTYKQLNCPICLETFQSPKILTCLHTFCEKCICRHARSLREVGDTEIITCPVCRNPTPAPADDQTMDEWAAKLANNSIVLSLLTSTRSSKDESVVCQPCVTLGKQNLSVAYCVTCSEYLCNHCYTCHKSFKMSKDHSVTVQSVHEEQNFNSTQSDMYCCYLHEEQYKYFCKSHKELCCSDCAIKDHRKCEELLLIKDLCKSNKEVKDNKQISENLDAAKKMFITLLETRSKTLELIEQQKIAITKSIQDWTTTIKEHVDRMQTAALEELNQMCKLETITISDQIVECKSAIAAIETSEEMLMGGRKSEDDTKIFITTTKVSCQVLKYLERYNSIENNSEIVELGFDIGNTCEGIIKTLSSIGIRRLVTIPKLSSDASLAAKKTILPKIKPNSMVTFSAKIPNDQEICDIRSGVFMTDEKCVLSDSGNKKLKLFNRRFQLASYVELDDENRYICRVDEGTVAVTVGTRIELVSVTNKLTPLRIISVGLSCYGIAFYQKNIIVDISGDSLLTYDSSEKIINRIMSYDTLDWHNTHCVSHDGQRIYYTTDDAVVTMDMKGDKLNRLESNDLKGASGIMADKQGIIYCCGMSSENVIQLTPEGRELGVLLSREHELKNPCGVCLNDLNDRIIVFEVNSNDVKVFEII